MKRTVKRTVPVFSALFLAGCQPPSTSTVHTTNGDPIEVAYLVLAPLCTLLCNTTVATTGSRVEGNGSNTQSTSQSIAPSQSRSTSITGTGSY